MNEANSREKGLFNAAMQLPTPQAREAFLREACAGDDQLRQRVEDLLRAAQPNNDVLEQPFAPGLGDQGQRATQDSIDLPLSQCSSPPPATGPAGQFPMPLTERPGDRIGHYKLLQQIGEGGCGVVYMAEQEEPIRRRVALKVIKLGMDTKQVIARFEAERQALALMDHPNIAKVLDAGATDTGRPYFVMELVRGIRITDYCDQNNLPTEARLDLFIRVCHAIQHAHQKGLIHRDIKPSNILVTVNDGVAVPKVIDFGIAKATEQRLTDKTLFTAFEQFIGTPTYMSPEQAEMTSLDIDTRSDIYALGVLLYELLTGQTPFDAKALIAAGLDEMRRIIREQEPVRPSTRLSSLDDGEQTTVAKRRHAEPPKLIHQVRGDLDWIVMRCLEKDRTRRYETANGLANDIERHLSNEPVVACPPTPVYRFTKLLRKHRAAVSALAAFLLLLLAATAVSTWLAAWANRERATAVKAAGAEARAKEESNRLRQLAEVRAESEGKARELAQKAQSAETEQRRKAEYESYVAKISLAAAKIDTHEVETARTILDSCPENLRHWEWGRLKRLCQAERWSFDSRRRLLTALMFPDAKRVLIASEYGRRSSNLQVCDTESGKQIAVFTHPADVAQHVLLLPTGRYAISTGDGSATYAAGQWNWVTDARLWDTATGKEVRRFDCGWQTTSRGEGPSAPCAALSPDGKILAVGGRNARVKIFEVETGKELADFATVGADQASTKEKRVWTMAFSPDGRLLLTGGEEATQVWEVQTAREVHRISQARGGNRTGYLLPDGTFIADGRSGVLTALFSPDGTTVFYSDGGGAGQFWNLSGWARSAEFQLGVAEIRCAAFSPDGKWLAVGTSDPGWAVVESATGKVLVSVPGAHGEEVLSVAFSSDGRRLLTASNNGTARLWVLWELKGKAASPVRVEELRLFFGHSARVTVAAFAPGEKQILTADDAGSVKLWDCDTTHQAVVFDDPQPGVRAAALSPDGRHVLTIASATWLWNARTGERLAEVSRPQFFGASSVTFSPDSRLAIARKSSSVMNGPDTAVRLWNIAENRLVTSCPALTKDWDSVALSPDGKRFYTGSDNESSIWNVETGQKIAVLKEARYYLGPALFSTDGRRLATRYGLSAGRYSRAYERRMIGAAETNFPAWKVWDADSGSELATFRRDVTQESEDFFIILSDDRTALCKDRSSAVVWDLDSGRRMREIKSSWGVVFSGDFRRLCRCGSDDVAQVLDFVSGEVISTLGGWGWPSGFSPDGRRVWTIGRNGIAQLWDADTGRELLSLKMGMANYRWSPQPVFSTDGQNVLLIANGRAQLLPAESWR